MGELFGGAIRVYLGVVGGALVLAALVTAARRLAAMAHGESTQGRVVGHQTSTIDDSTTFSPIVEFTDREHRTRRFVSAAGGASRHPQEGAPVRVRYLRANPDVAFIPTFLHMWAAPLALAVLGCAAILAGWG